MQINIDRQMSRLNERLMSGAQYTLDGIGYVLDEMEAYAEQYPDRDDIRACIDEIKSKNKKAVIECWTTANHWVEHFDGLGDDVSNEESDDASDEEEGELDGEAVDDASVNENEEK